MRRWAQCDWKLALLFLKRSFSWYNYKQSWLWTIEQHKSEPWAASGSLERRQFNTTGGTCMREQWWKAEKDFNTVRFFFFVLVLAPLLPLNSGDKRGDINDFEQRQSRILFEEHPLIPSLPPLFAPDLTSSLPSKLFFLLNFSWKLVPQQVTQTAA